MKPTSSREAAAQKASGKGDQGNQGKTFVDDQGLFNAKNEDGELCVISNGQLVGVKQSAEHQGDRPRICASAPCRIGCSAWCWKYFWEGQSLSGSAKVNSHEVDANASWGTKVLRRYRRPLSMVLPAALCHFVWWSVMIRYQLWHLFEDKYPMSITMVFGSIVAGMTSEGGGAVAFPVMTLALGVSPVIARDFSIFIQACGMSCATFAIFFMKVCIEWCSIMFCTLGGAIGLLIGLEFVDPLLTPAQKKMGFVSVWFSFAFALFLLNRYHKRKTYKKIPDFKVWKAVALLLAGFVGGIFTSFAGSGLDICSFSVLTLLFRVSEKTATPTSVILMAFNSLLGMFWRIVMMADVQRDVFEYLAVCVSIVVLGAPFGSVLGSHFHRQVLAALVYILDAVSLVSAFILVPQTPVLAGMSVGIIIGGFIFFFVLTKLGHIVMERFEKKNTAQLDQKETGQKDIFEDGVRNDGYDCSPDAMTLNIARL